MKQYQLTEDTQGFAKGTIFEGPKPIPNNEFTDANGINHSHINLGQGYFEVGKENPMCFFADFVEGNPALFKEVVNG